MKKILIIILVLLVFPLMAAVQISMNTNLSQGETLLANVSGTFVNPLQESNILLYEGHVRVAFVPYLNQKNGTYYIYGQLTGKSSGNYSLVLSNIKYYEYGVINNSDVSKDFTISNHIADFSITPGFIDSNHSFYITLNSLSGKSLTINSQILYVSSGAVLPGSGSSISLLPGQTKSVYFPVSTANSSEFKAKISSPETVYNIPVFLNLPKPSVPIENNTSTNNTIPENNTQTPNGTQTNNTSGNNTSFNVTTNLTTVATIGFGVQPTNMNISLPLNSSAIRYLYIHNPSQSPGQFKAVISDNLRQYLYLEDNSLTVPPNSTSKIKMKIISGTTEKTLNGSIGIFSGGLSVVLSNIKLNFSKNYVLPNASSSQSLFDTCMQLGGISCNVSSNCTGQMTNAQDGPCCLGTCKAKPVKNNTWKIIGWSAAGLAIIFILVFFLKRYKKAKKRPINLFGVMKKKE